MFRRNILSILMILFFMFPGCSLKEKKASDFIRFIDVLTLKNIHRSPFLQDDPSSSDYIKKYPTKSIPLTEKGIGDNPWGIKRKLRTGGVERNVLFAPPDSEYRFPVKNNSGGKLEFGIGIVREKNSLDSKERSMDSKGVNFIVQLGNKDNIKTVFQKYISLLPEGDQEFIFSRHSIVLPR